jgi:hypothetical protein
MVTRKAFRNPENGLWDRVYHLPNLSSPADPKPNKFECISGTSRANLWLTMADQKEFAEFPSPSSAPSGMPQFSKAEYAHVPGTERCRICNNLISGDYFRVNGLMACNQCASEARDGQPRDSHIAFSRGLVFGVGAAVIGIIGYAGFTIVTGWYIGYLALGVGYLIAKAIKKGASGLGGRRYQIAAVILTYSAISIAAVPIGISAAIKQAKAERKVEPKMSSSVPDASSQQVHPNRAPIAPGAFAGRLLLLGLASPFLELQDPMHGAIGLFILFIGLRIAWQLTASAPLDVEGPYTVPVTA